MSSDSNNFNESKKTSHSTEEEWDFDISADEPKSAPEETKKNKILGPRAEKLELDISSKPKAETREQLYKELKSQEITEDVIEASPLLKRYMAGIIDYSILFVLFKVCQFLAPMESAFVSYIFEKKHYIWTLKPQYIDPLFTYSTFSFLVFFMLIILSIFQNYTLGKLFLKIRVRGANQYLLSFEQVLYRELIVKPISGMLLIGFIFPLFNKERKFLHDIITETLVVNE